jgi:hypothetical protein
MPPKVKPLPTNKPTKKDMAAASAKPPPPAAPAAAPAAATSFSVDAEDPTITVSYYAVGAYDYADVVFRINGTM